MSPSVGAVLAAARHVDAGIGVRDARLLLQQVLGATHADLATHPERELPADALARFSALAARRVAGEPLAYLLGRREFHGIDFEVSAAVLIPRPETELLVEMAAAAAGAGTARILDLGTGSGCIAVALARLLPRAQVTAVDASAEALEVACRNAARHRVPLRLLRGDWFAAVGAEQFDLIVANPPYVADGDPHLIEGDLRFEPRRALASGKDGLDDLRRIVGAAPRHLVSGGRIFVEHGYDQADAVAALLRGAGFVDLVHHTDLAEIPRVAGGRRP